MNPHDDAASLEDAKISAALKSVAAPAARLDARLKRAFAERLRHVAAHPDVVPIEFDGRKIEVRRGGTILAAALKNDLRLMPPAA